MWQKISTWYLIIFSVNFISALYEIETNVPVTGILINKLIIKLYKMAIAEVAGSSSHRF